MIRTIEKYHTGVIQKVLSPCGDLIRYQAGIPGNTASITACSTLAEARKVIGVNITPPAIETKPKMANPQNQKGYKAPQR